MKIAKVMNFLKDSWTMKILVLLSCCRFCLFVNSLDRNSLLYFLIYLVPVTPSSFLVTSVFPSNILPQNIRGHLPYSLLACPSLNLSCKEGFFLCDQRSGTRRNEAGVKRLYKKFTDVRWKEKRTKEDN